MNFFPSLEELLLFFLWQIASPLVGIVLLMFSAMLFARDREKNNDVYGPLEIRNTTALFSGVLGLILVLVPFDIRFSMWAEEAEQRAKIQEA